MNITTKTFKLILFSAFLFISNSTLAAPSSKATQIAIGLTTSCALTNSTEVVCWENTTGKEYVVPNEMRGTSLHYLFFFNDSHLLMDSLKYRADAFCVSSSTDWHCWGAPGSYFAELQDSSDPAMKLLKATPSFVRKGNIAKVVFGSFYHKPPNHDYYRFFNLCFNDEYGVQCWAGWPKVALQYSEYSNQIHGKTVSIVSTIDEQKYFSQPSIENCFRDMSVFISAKDEGLFQACVGASYNYELSYVEQKNRYPLNIQIIDKTKSYTLTNLGLSRCDHTASCDLSNPDFRISNGAKIMDMDLNDRGELCVKTKNGKIECKSKISLPIPTALQGLELYDYIIGNERNSGCFATEKGLWCSDSMSQGNYYYKMRVPLRLSL